MLIKSRTEPCEALTLEILNKRKELTPKDKQYLLNLKKGYEGEVQFDHLTEMLQSECYILNDLLLKLNNTTFQIDSLIIKAKKIYLFEVKNYEGEFYYESEKFYKKPQIEKINPLHQLSRSESLLRQLLLNLGINLPVESYVIFINPDFTLYHAPLNKSIILPTQLQNFMKQFDSSSVKLSEKHKKIAEKLLYMHITDSPFTQLPPYKYDELRKGITCLSCNSFSISIKERFCLCHECGHKELVTNAVLRAVEEYKLLFPNEKITTKRILEWCVVVKSRKRINRILTRCFTKVGDHRWSYYE